MAASKVQGERREHFRVDLAMPVAYWRETDHIQTGLHPMSVNISGSGMRFMANRPMAVGETVSLRIGLPDRIVPAQAKVVRVEGRSASDSSVSMQFSAIGNQDQERLVDYIFAV